MTVSNINRIEKLQFTSILFEKIDQKLISADRFNKVLQQSLYSLSSASIEQGENLLILLDTIQRLLDQKLFIKGEELLSLVITYKISEKLHQILQIYSELKDYAEKFIIVAVLTTTFKLSLHLQSSEWIIQDQLMQTIISPRISMILLQSSKDFQFYSKVVSRLISTYSDNETVLYLSLEFIIQFDKSFIHQKLQMFDIPSVYAYQLLAKSISSHIKEWSIHRPRLVEQLIYFQMMILQQFVDTLVHHERSNNSKDSEITLSSVRNVLGHSINILSDLTFCSHAFKNSNESQGHYLVLVPSLDLSFKDVAVVSFGHLNMYLAHLKDLFQSSSDVKQSDDIYRRFESAVTWYISQLNFCMQSDKYTQQQKVNISYECASEVVIALLTMDSLLKDKSKKFYLENLRQIAQKYISE